MDYKVTAERILEYVGGPENVANVSHCATRLRLILKDESLADDDAIRALDGIPNVAHGSGQYQILVGINVPKLYERFRPLVTGGAAETAVAVDEGGSPVTNVFSAISAIFSPLLAPLAGSGVLRGLLILCTQLGWIAEGSSTYTILYSASMAVFYFLPVLLAVSAAKRFGANPYISALIGAALIYPDFLGLMGDVGNGAMGDFFGIPVVLMNYSSTVIPIILAIWVYSHLFKLLDSKVPEDLQLVVTPLVSLVVMVPLTMIVIGPIGVYGGEVIAAGVNWLLGVSGMVAGAVVGGGWSVLVSVGMHWAVNPIMINNIAQNGMDCVCPMTFACNFAVIGVALGVFLKAKDRDVKSFSLTGVITIVLSAIIEPTLFGLLVKNKRLFLAQIVAGAVGGAVLGLLQVHTTAFVFGSVVTFPAFISADMMNFVNAMIGLGISTVLGAVLGYAFCKKDEKLV